MSPVALSTLDLVLAASLILVNGVLSWLFRLGLERTLVVAALRMVAQLTLIGLVLRWIFAATSPWWTVALSLVMVAAAGLEVVGRQHRRIEGPGTLLLGTSTLLTVGLVATAFAMLAAIRPEPLHAPQYVLPILGMVLGNALTGMSLVLDTMTEAAGRERAAIEARLALGQSRLEALSGPLRGSLRTGMMPILNAMAASGIVSLPGMMTGQILSGVDPVEATKYQILIMFLIAGATALAVVAAGIGGVHLLTDARHRLRLDRVRAQRDPG
ncbi:MAG: ABC transporter permease [Pseudomonadota bacterium]